MKCQQRFEVRGGGDFIYNMYWSLMRSALVLAIQCMVTHFTRRAFFSSYGSYTVPN